jgi:hypothetical protein
MVVYLQHECDGIVHEYQNHSVLSTSVTNRFEHNGVSVRFLKGSDGSRHRHRRRIPGPQEQ